MMRGLSIKTVVIGFLLVTALVFTYGNFAMADDGSSIGVTALMANFSAKDLNATFNVDSATHITFNDNLITVIGEGTEVTGNIVKIQVGGTYILQGTIADGQVIVEADAKADVRLVLNGVNITSVSSTPLNVISADKVIVILAEDTKNIISDSSRDTVLENAELNAAIFSKEDLTINGTGSLIVNGNNHHGIVSKDDLKIVSGNITINAVGDGLKGRDMVAIKAGQININAQQDGIQSSNADDPAKGFVYIEGGLLSIVAELDGIQAESQLIINNGDLAIISGGGSKNSSSKTTTNWGNWGQVRTQSTNTPSAKGIKAAVAIFISGGNITIDSFDDSIHSNDSILISGGVIRCSSGDDGIHADSKLVINAGEIEISKSYEGLESMAISINGGQLKVVSSDDGINVAGGNDGSAINGRPGQNTFMSQANANLTITGGLMYVYTDGDGIDANGNIDMSGGTLIIVGPTSSGDSAVDYDGHFNITGGILVAAGSDRMAMAPSSSSVQKSLAINTSVARDTLVHIEATTGEPVLTFRAPKAYQSLVISAPVIKEGITYNVYTGGTIAGEEYNGLFLSGNYTPGAKVTTTTTSSVSQGQFGLMMPRGPMPGGRW